MKLKSLLAVSAAACIVASGAMAGTISFTSVVGEWTNIVGGTNTSGLGTSSIRWGNSTGFGQSGYDFVGVAPPTISGILPDAVFDLGTFSHVNQPIDSGTSITGATLKVFFDFFIDTDPSTTYSRSSTFIFNHFETPNAAAPCADGGTNGFGVNVNGCADNVNPVTNPGFSESFDVDGITYLLDVTGFDIGSTFWTQEQATNTAKIQARYTEKSNVAPVPVPAAGLLLLSAIGGSLALARRRKAA